MNNKTFENQDKLQIFPVPSMANTEKQLLEWMAPLVDEQQLHKTNQVVSEFFKKNGEGEKLQQKLYELKEQAEGGSWLTPLWDAHYLDYRGSLPTGMHFNILLNKPKIKTKSTTAELAGKASFLVGEYYHKIIDEKIEPVWLRGVPLDMGQYKKFFRSVRVPQENSDRFTVAPFDKKNNFVVLIYRNNMYRVPVTNEKGELYQSKYIIQAMNQIFQEHTEKGLNIGVYTTAEREEAAEIYQALQKSPINAENLQALADALVVISIDEESDNATEAVKNLMVSSQSKYFDKTIQLVITKSGQIGYSIEHTAVDGTTIFEVIRYVNEGLIEPQDEVIETEDIPLIQPLQWEISSDMQVALKTFEKENIARRNDFHIESMPPHTFGAEAIKGMKISPDAFFHMALQIAQYRTFGVFKSVYEPVSIRHFKEGRTECARATSKEKVAVVQAIEQKKSSAEIYALMEKASAAHSKRIASARDGFGIERHMFGLEQAYLRYGDELGIHEYPAIFQDLGYKTLRTDFLSTSGMAYDNVHSRIFAPVVEGGFGVAYILLAQSISLNISCRVTEKEQARKLSRYICKALDELNKIAEEALLQKKE